MAAPTGNTFWKKRAKHGREKIFKTPNQLLDAAYEYFEYQSGQKWNRKDYRGTNRKEVDIPTQAPFSLRGLCIFLGVNTVYFNHFESSLDPKKNKKDKDFSKVITHIREIIECQQLEGAAVGAFNANIVSRLLGLKDKQEHVHKVTTVNFKS